ncbi:MAG TPA: DoxX family protein [Pyrinomonadaceae bacterium]
MNIALWIIQALLALLFMFAGVTKFTMSVEEMTRQMPVALSGNLIHFIGVCEILGGLGLILPALLRIKPGLTPLAAACLVIIMIGAVVITMMGGMISAAIFPAVVGIALAFVAYGRWKLSPITAR